MTGWTYENIMKDINGYKEYSKTLYGTDANILIWHQNRLVLVENLIKEQRKEKLNKIYEIKTDI